MSFLGTALSLQGADLSHIHHCKHTHILCPPEVQGMLWVCYNHLGQEACMFLFRSPIESTQVTGTACNLSPNLDYFSLLLVWSVFTCS